MKVRAETRKVENDTMQTLVKSNSRLSKIVVILPYFGEFPNYFDFFLQSCASNPTIDFLIISNRKIDCDAGNIHVENCSFEAFRQLVMDHFSYPVTLDKPYKLCDFKSYYRMILADRVKEYDFWGFCDCDLIFGDIRRFLTEDILTTHDFIFDMGQFQLHRVGDQNYLDVIDDYRGKDNLSAREILNLPRNFALDELPFGIPRDYYIRFPERFFSQFDSTRGRVLDNPNPRYIHFVDIFNSRRYYYRNMYFEFSEQLPLWRREFPENYREAVNVIYCYRNGHLKRLFVRDGKVEQDEILLVHFRQKNFSLHTDSYSDYFIVPGKFIDSQENLDKYILWKYGHRRIDIRRYSPQALCNRIIRKIKSHL